MSTLVIALLMAATLSMLLLAGRSMRRPRPPRRPRPGADTALRRHPAGRARTVLPETRPADGPPRQRSPVGPDDDPEFIDALERLIRGGDPGPTDRLSGTARPRR